MFGWSSETRISLERIMTFNKSIPKIKSRIKTFIMIFAHNHAYDKVSPNS